MLKLLFGGIAAVGLFIGGLFGQHTLQPTTPDSTPTFGAFSPTGGSTYRLGQSVGTSDSSIKLSSFKEPVSNTPYTMTYLNSDIEYGTLSPQSSISEFISFTGITQNSDGSALLTGVKRGLSRTPAGVGCVASTTLAQPHAGQSIFILSNSPCFYSEYTPLRTNATSTGILVFSSTTPPRLDQPGAQASGTYISTTSEFATYALVAAVANAGTVNATESVKGVGELATQVEMASSSLAGSTGASLFLYAKYATSSPWQAGIYVPITQNDGKLNPNFIATSSAYIYNWAASTTYSGRLLASATTTIAASGTSSAPLILNSNPYAYPAAQGATSTVLVNTGDGTLVNETLPGVKLGEVALSGATTTLTLAATTTVNEVFISIHGTVSCGSGIRSLQLNPNTTTGSGANYSYEVKAQDGAAIDGSSVNVIHLDSTSGNGDVYYTIHLANDLAMKKILNWQGSFQSGITSWGTALLNDTSNQLKSTAIGAGASGCTFTAGRMTVYAGQ